MAGGPYTTGSVPVAQNTTNRAPPYPRSSRRKALSSRIRSTMPTQIRLLIAAALTAATAFAAVGPAAAVTEPAAAPFPSGSTIPLGDGYMGVGYVQDAKNFKPD